MIAESLITTAILPLRTSDTGEESLAIMDDFHVRHLPIVNDKQLLGVLSDDDILLHDVTEPVGSYALSMHRPYVKTTDHIYEVMRLLADHQLTVIPVVNADNDYEGMISQEDVLNFFAKTASFSDSGSIVILEIARRDYTMTEISRIVESEGAQILSSFITSEHDAHLMEVTIKINRQNIQKIISTFERFNYVIKASFNEQEYLESLQERYDSLMSYLSI